MLMFHQFRQNPMGSFRTFGGAGFIESQANGKGVDEHADDTVRAGAAAHAAEENGAEDDV